MALQATAVAKSASNVKKQWVHKSRSYRLGIIPQCRKFMQDKQTSSAILKALYI